jgi:hypothetical protein
VGGVCMCVLARGCTRCGSAACVWHARGRVYVGAVCATVGLYSTIVSELPLSTSFC